MRRGFTLIETLIALAIAGLALAVMFRSIGTGLTGSHLSSRYQEALSRAKSHLAAVGRDVAPIAGTRSGDDGGGYRWSLAVAPVAGEPVAGGMSLFRVVVDVSWQEGDTPRHVVLETRRLGRVGKEQ